MTAISAGIATAIIAGFFGMLTALVKVVVEVKKIKEEGVASRANRLDANIWKLVEEAQSERQAALTEISDLKHEVRELSDRVKTLEDDKIASRLRIVELEHENERLRRGGAG